VPSRLLQDYHLQKNSQEDKRRFRLFVSAQLVQYAALLLLFLGGLCLAVFGLWTIL
jgi:hypothetical protein